MCEVVVEKKYKFSYYNSKYEENNEIYLYNSLTGLKCRIVDSELITQINELENNSKYKSDLDVRLINTKIAIDEGVDERIVAGDVIISRLTNNRDKLRLIVLPTRECNFRCKYCYEVKKNENMTTETAKSLIQAVKKYLNDNISISSVLIEWFGGEPLLCYDMIIMISSKLKEYCDKKGISFSMTMTTNGYLLNEDRVRKFLSLNLFEYQITVDGTSEYHDKLRQLKDGSGTWEKIYNNLLMMKGFDDNRLSVTIRINYHVGMLEKIDEFISMIKKDFDSRFSVYAIRINPTQEFEKEFIPVSAEAEPFALEYIIELLKKNGLSIVRYMSNLSPTASVCYARMNYVYVIDTDGTLRKCTEYLEDNRWNNIGTIRNGVFEIDYFKHLQWIYPKPEYLQEKGCYTCKDYPNCCGGLCPAKWVMNNTTVCNTLRGFNKNFLEKYIYEKRNI